MKLLIFLIGLAAQAQIIEWIGIPVDPPGTNPVRIIRAITVQKGKPTIVEPFVAEPPGTPGGGHYESVQATQMDGSWWCLHSSANVVMLGTAIEIDNFTYTFNSQLNLPPPVIRMGCGAAIDIRNGAQNNPSWVAKRVGAMLWVRE